MFTKRGRVNSWRAITAPLPRPEVDVVDPVISLNSNEILLRVISVTFDKDDSDETDEEVADVMNYILNSWGNTSKKMVTEKEVKKLKKE